MKVIIAGSRNFADYPSMKKKMDNFCKENKISEIVSGAAKGADAMGEKYAEENGIPVKLFPADWDTHKRAAGPIRNAQMADYADCLIAIWDGSSRGTKNMIDNMHKRKKPVYVMMFNIEVTAHGVCP